jgi:DNA-binding NarL/FixJ family response regulator
MRLLLVDDHLLFLEGVTNLLKAYGMEVAGVAANGFEAVAMVDKLKPDVVLMDIRMPECDGLSATRTIKTRHPEIDIIILTTTDGDEELFEAIRCGASGYLLKSMSGRAFIDALTGFENGLPPFSPGIAERLLEEFARMSAAPASKNDASHKLEDNQQDQWKDILNERQQDVLNLVAAGLTYKEIGGRLKLSERTIRYHMKEILDRLHLEHRSQAIAFSTKLRSTKPKP